MKIVFMGTSSFSLCSLKGLVEKGRNVVAVITQPDKPCGRGLIDTNNPVKNYAVEKDIPVYQFKRVSDEEGISLLEKIKPDLIVTSAYGQILSEKLLSIPKFGVFNVHASLLPKYRGASPVNWAIINGDKESGVTIMRTVKELDKGDIIYSEKTEILPQDTAGSLFDKLAKLGAKCLNIAIDLLESGKAVFVKQDDEKATYCKQLKKEDGLINFDDYSDNLVNFIRGTNPWPCAYTFHGKNTVKIYEAEKVDINSDFYKKFIKDKNCSVSTVVCGDGKIAVVCKDGAVFLKLLQKQGKKVLSSSDFLNGYQIKSGEVFSNEIR